MQGVIDGIGSHFSSGNSDSPLVEVRPDSGV